jgi:hypothetical protein
MKNQWKFRASLYLLYKAKFIQTLFYYCERIFDNPLLHLFFSPFREEEGKTDPSALSNMDGKCWQNSFLLGLIC